MKKQALISEKAQQAEIWFNEAMEIVKTMFFPYIMTQKGKFILYLKKQTWNYVMLNRWILEKAQTDKSKEDVVVRVQLFALFLVTLGLGLLIMASAIGVFFFALNEMHKFFEIF